MALAKWIAASGDENALSPARALDPWRWPRGSQLWVRECHFRSKLRKALDNIDLNLVSHRYVSGVLKDDHFVSACSRAPRF